MKISFCTAQQTDVEPLFSLCKGLIDAYEDVDSIDYEKVLGWVKRKIEGEIAFYRCIMVDGVKAGYVHFYPDGAEMEIDDLYVFPTFRNRGIGTEVIRLCLLETDRPVHLYVFRRNEGAVRLYKRIGFEIRETVHNTRYLMRKA